MTVAPSMPDSALRAYLRRGLNAHMSALGYQNPRSAGAADTPEIVRRNAVRGRIAYGETVLHEDMGSQSCHERLMSFSKRRTRRRSTILFFIGVVETQQSELEGLLEKLGIHSAAGGGHVHVVPIAAPNGTDPSPPASTRQLP
jgi:hypothetical protein